MKQLVTFFVLYSIMRQEKILSLIHIFFGENLFDDFFGDFPFYYDDRAMKDAEKKLYGHKANHVMKTDIKEMSNGYELIVDLPEMCIRDRWYTAAVR